jgi:DNA adenine methylase
MIFRYPGGKSKLARHLVDDYLAKLLPEHAPFHDVFVGGGSVLCAVAQRFPGIQLFANDIDPNMAAFWRVIAAPSGRLERLLRRLERRPTMTLFKSLRAEAPSDDVERAYRAVFFNRTTFSGISTANPIGGWSQTSRWAINCRYNYAALECGIRAMVELFNGRLTVSSLHFRDYLASVGDAQCLYLDPPYYHKGHRLYPTYMDESEHAELAELLRLRDAWVLSYDACQEVDAFYQWAVRDQLDMRYTVSGEKASWAKKQEYIIVPQRSSP